MSCVPLSAVLHFLPARGARDTVTQYTSRLGPGSAVVITVGGTDDPGLAEAVATGLLKTSIHNARMLRYRCKLGQNDMPLPIGKARHHGRVGPYRPGRLVGDAGRTADDRPEDGLTFRSPGPGIRRAATRSDTRWSRGRIKFAPSVHPEGRLRRLRRTTVAPHNDLWQVSVPEAGSTAGPRRGEQDERAVAWMSSRAS